MALTSQDFLAQFPEFAAAPSSQVIAKLQAAQFFCDRNKWGPYFEQGVFLKAAHMLSLSPGGEKMRLAKGSPDTVYSIQWNDMLMSLGARTLAT